MEGASPAEVAEAEAAAREAFGEVLLLAKHWKEHSRRLSKPTARPMLRILLADLVFSVLRTVEIPKKRVKSSKGRSKTLLRPRTREGPVPMKSRLLKWWSVKISKMLSRVGFQWEKQQEKRSMWLTEMLSLAVMARTSM